MSGGAREKEQHCARDVDSEHTHTARRDGWRVSGEDQGIRGSELGTQMGG